MKYPIVILLFKILLFSSCTNKVEKNKNEIFIADKEYITDLTESSKKYPDSLDRQIINEVERESILFEKKLNKEYLTSEQIKFSIDTFKIKAKRIKRQHFDYSTDGMNNSVLESRDEYKKLLKEYYTKLSDKLNTLDREKLKISQKNWLMYRKSEEDLIHVMMNSNYNIGGTIQSSIAIANSFKIVEDRLIQIFSYYNSIIEKEELEKE